MKRLMIFIATCGPFGYSPVAPGTAGSALAVPIAVFMTALPWPGQLSLIIALYFIFVRAAGVAEDHFGKKDPGPVVCDEVLGYLVSMFALPPDSAHLAMGFLLFRVFDIVKPWPIKLLERKLPGGWGVVTDDVMAGVFTQITLRILL